MNNADMKLEITFSQLEKMLYVMLPKFYSKLMPKKDVEEVTRENFVDMIVRAMYEMVFLSYFNEPTENDYFSGHTLPVPEG